MRKRFHQALWTQDRIRTQKSVRRMMTHQSKAVEVLEDSLTRPRRQIAAHLKNPWKWLPNPV